MLGHAQLPDGNGMAPRGPMSWRAGCRPAEVVALDLNDYHLFHATGSFFAARCAVR